MKRVFVMNGGTRFYIIDSTPEKLLLQRLDDGELVIAHAWYKFGTGSTVWWNHGSYFGHNLLGAVKEFYGKGRFEGGQESGETNVLDKVWPRVSKE